jgi:hypothetical protein
LTGPISSTRRTATDHPTLEEKIVTLIDEHPRTPDTVEVEPEHRMSILDHAGDTRISWRRSNTTEVATARAAFDTARGKGYLAYRVDADDQTKGEVMRTFDPTAEEIILAPPTAGG